MTEEQIIDKALENLQKTAQIEGKWLKNGENPNLDGRLQMKVEGEVFVFNVEIKNEPKNQMVPQLCQYNQVNKPFILVAFRLSSTIKKELREKEIAYLEANGNLYLKEKNKWVWLDTNPSLAVEKNDRNRAFTKTGLRVMFEFLMNHSLINLPYRQIAEQTGTSIGNITHIINGLKQDNFLIAITKNQYQLTNKKELLEKWVTAYEERLKPVLKIGTFRFLKESDFNNWQEIDLQEDKSFWGGEPAGDLLTNYLHPAELTIYTEESRSDLMKKYRLIPDSNGNIQVYKKFWNVNHETLTVPPVLVYADLINQNDRRCTETAEKIYEQYLQN